MKLLRNVFDVHKVNRNILAFMEFTSPLRGYVHQTAASLAASRTKPSVRGVSG